MPSRDIKDCVTELQDKWPLLKAEFQRRFPGWVMLLTCTHRTPEEQFELFKRGRRPIGDGWAVARAAEVVTYKDGLKDLSNHNYYPARAFDFALQKPDGDLTWDLKEDAWKAVPDIVHKFGLVSGGTWKKLVDYPHVETNKSGWV